MRNNIQKLAQLMNHTQALNIMQPGKQLQMWQESHRPSLKSPSSMKSSWFHYLYPPGPLPCIMCFSFTPSNVLLAYSFSRFRKASCRRWDLKSLIDGHSTFSETQEDNQGRKEECL